MSASTGGSSVSSPVEIATQFAENPSSPRISKAGAKERNGGIDALCAADRRLVVQGNRSVQLAGWPAEPGLVDGPVLSAGGRLHAARPSVARIV
jgi:hypothetical protein